MWRGCLITTALAAASGPGDKVPAIKFVGIQFLRFVRSTGNLASLLTHDNQISGINKSVKLLQLRQDNLQANSINVEEHLKRLCLTNL